MCHDAGTATAGTTIVGNSYAQGGQAVCELDGCVQNMPEDFLLRNVNGQDVWVSEGETDSVEIKAQSHVRIKIANVQLQPEKLVRRRRACTRSHCYFPSLQLSSVTVSKALAFATVCWVMLLHSRMLMLRALSIVLLCGGSFDASTQCTVCVSQKHLCMQGGVATMKGHYLGVLAI